MTFAFSEHLMSAAKQSEEATLTRVQRPTSAMFLKLVTLTFEHLKQNK